MNAGFQGSFRGLLFGMADVLYDASGWRRWLAQLLARFELAVDYSTVTQGLASEPMLAACRHGGDYWRAMHGWLAQLGLAGGSCDEVVASAKSRWRDLHGELRPLPGVKKTLQRLFQAGLPLAVLENSSQPATQLRQYLQALKLDEFFCQVFSSADLGETMPTGACYSQVLKSLHWSAQETLLVSACPNNLRGARKLGLMTAAALPEPHDAADFSLTKFEQLADLPTTIASRALAG